MTLVAAGAATVLLAPAAQGGLLEASEYPATLTGQQIQGEVTGEKSTKLEVTGVVGTVKCSVVTFHGVIVEESEEATLTPTIKECLIAGILETVAMNECAFRLKAGATVEASPDKISATTEIVCPAGKEIVVTVDSSPCTTKIPAQNGLGGITAENQTGASPKMDLVATLDMSKIKYTIENGNSCPNSPEDGVREDQSIKGLVTPQAEKVGGGTPGETGLTVT